MTEPGGHRTHVVEIAGTGDRFEVREGERILTAARRAGLWLPFECGWGSCGTCKATLVEGETRLVFAGAPAVDARDERRRRVVLCQSTAVSDLVLKPLRVDREPVPERPTVDVRAVLTSVEPLSEDISGFRFETSEPVPFRPGQYAVLEVAPGLRRCYSMANLPGGSELELVAKRYPGGVGSSGLFGLPVGAEVAVEAPYGDMWLRPSDRPVVLVAGGTGVSAILALLRELAGSRSQRRVLVAYGATRAPDLVRWAELAELAGGLADAELVGSLLAPPPGGTGSRASSPTPSFPGCPTCSPPTSTSPVHRRWSTP
ncbi:MAG: 2Fe-2S iron-sulfur cluster-binding protein [Nocardioidaceae bacterium]